MVSRTSRGAVLIFGSIFAVGLLCSYAAAAEKSYIAKAFKEAAFNPHAFLEAEIVARYGAGDVRKTQYFVDHRCWDPGAGLAAVVTVDAEPAEQYRIAAEITVVAKEVGVPSKNLEELDTIALFGVKIGDDQAAAQSVAKRKYGSQSIRTKLLGEHVTQLMFFASEERTNTFYKYYLKDGHVMAMAIGLTD